jgi:hypothetical protein
MTMLSFRIEQEEATQVQRWADRLGVDRSELLRAAVRAHLVGLDSVVDADTWERIPLGADERALGKISVWGPAEDWSDWVDGHRLFERAGVTR